MSLSDPISDALTMIRNANRAKLERVDLKSSKMMTEILKILRREKFIHDFRLIEDKRQGILRVYLKKANEPVRKINQIVRISKPSRRVYAKSQLMPKVLNGMGLCVISTPQGIISGEDARKRSVGGEVLLKVW